MSITEPPENNEQITSADEYFNDQFGSLLNTLSLFKIQITTMSNQIKSLEKNVKKEIKQNK